MTTKLLETVKNGTVRPLSARWQTAAGISGSISIASWSTITVVDFFYSLTLSYPQMLLCYLVWVSCAYVGYILTERIQKKHLATATAI
jgi:hypothetical protein